MSRESDEKRKDKDASGRAASAEQQELERRLSEVLGGVPELEADGDPSQREDEAPDDAHPRLRLDKTGALADRPKLQPRRAYPVRPDGPQPSEPAGPGSPEGEGEGPRRAQVPPPLGSLRPPELDEALRGPPDDEVQIPGGSFLYGEERADHDVPAFRIDRTPVTNATYRYFVRATGHRAPLYWPDGEMPEELADHPVVGVDYFDALAYAHWKGKDLPYEDEWERAARGVDGRTYPWGNDPEPGQANTARLGHKMTLPVAWHEMNVSPDGVRDLVGNVWELTHSPAPGGGVVVRGGSWYDFALYAKTWFRFASRPDARNGTIGFRCVRRDRDRPGQPREVEPDAVEAEIASRKGPQPQVDPSSLSADRRDLVPDLRRLRNLLADRAEEEAALAGTGPSPVTAPAPRKTPRKATPPPPIQVAPAPAEPRSEAPPSVARAPAPRVRAPERPAARAPAPAPRPPPRRAAAPAGAGAEGPAAAAASPPLLFWGIVGGALALVATFLVLLLAGVFTPEPAPQEVPVAAAPPSPLPVVPPSLVDRLPPAPPVGAADDRPPRWVDGMRPGWQQRLERGILLLVFVDGDGGRAQDSVESATRLSERLQGTDVEVVLVLPREGFAEPDGRPLGEADRVARLHELGGRGNLLVFLDPAVGPPLGSVLRSRYRVRDPIAAVLIADGRLEARTTPLLDGALSLAALAPIALQGLEVAGEAGDDGPR